MNPSLTPPPGTLLGILLLVIAATGGAVAEDGQLLKSSAVVLPETAIAAMEQRKPDIRNVLGKIEISAITDGLKVKGYLLLLDRKATARGKIASFERRLLG